MPKAKFLVDLNERVTLLIELDYDELDKHRKARSVDGQSGINQNTTKEPCQAKSNFSSP